jgi:hypothetical protein
VTRLGLDEEAEARLELAAHEQRLVVVGGHRPLAGAPGFTELVVTEAWSAVGDGPAVGLFTRVVDSGVRCVTTPCPVLVEEWLNLGEEHELAGLDFAPAGADERELQLASVALADTGIVVAGTEYVVNGPAGEMAGRVVTRLYLPFE